MKLGDKVRIQGPSFRIGTIRYIGIVPNVNDKEEFVGIELDFPLGKNDGTLNGKRYFSCKQQHGVFVPKHRVCGNFVNKDKSKDELDPSENVNVFLNDFQKKVDYFHNMLDTVENNVDHVLNKSLPMEIKALQDMAAKGSVFLSKYDQRQNQLNIAELEKALEVKKNKVAPRKKFSFSARKNQSVKVIQKDSKVELKEVVEEVDDRVEKFENRENEIILIDTGRDGMDVALNRLTNCIVVVKVPLYALRGNHLMNCKVYTGPVNGSVLLHHCTDSTFMIACRQMRIHDTTKCDFLLRIKSTPIIESCSMVRFGPYNVEYDGIEQQLEDALMSIDKENWKKVNDFKWLKVQQSPNWSVMDQDSMNDIKIDAKVDHMIGLTIEY